MNENFNQLFYYLENEKIFIDKSEFIFQIQSHPDYPSLLSISDTLSFFKIENFAVNISTSEIELLPNKFMALLNYENNSGLYFIEKNKDNNFVIKNKKKQLLNITEFKDKWKNIVLVAERNEHEVKPNKNSSNWLLSLVVVFFTTTIFFLDTDFKNKLFFLFPALGILFSIIALQDLFGAKSELINSFCNISESTSCSSVIDSRKWKIFNYISFGDLSIIFFSSQFFGLIAYILEGNVVSFFMMQEILLFCAIPVIILSLYFQKFIEKKWCPICLIIILITIVESLYLYFSNSSISIGKDTILLFLFISLFIYLGWSLLKKVLIQNKELKEFQFKANRFIRNYEVFKNSLISKEKFEFPSTNIVLGNKNSILVINLITNPFCGHCKKVHQILDSILDKHFDNIQIQIIIKANLENETEDKKSFYRTLVDLYLNQGQDKFRYALNYWFENNNIDNWLTLFKSEKNNVNEIDAIYKEHNDWTSKNDLNYTPVLFINGFIYPNNYDRENLEFYINDLIADTDFN